MTKFIVPLCSDQLARALRLRLRLGGLPDLCAPFPPRPAWMREGTYANLRSKALDFETRALEMEARFLASQIAKHAGGVKSDS